MEKNNTHQVASRHYYLRQLIWIIPVLVGAALYAFYDRSFLPHFLLAVVALSIKFLFSSTVTVYGDSVYVRDGVNQYTYYFTEKLRTTNFYPGIRISTPKNNAEAFIYPKNYSSPEALRRTLIDSFPNAQVDISLKEDDQLRQILKSLPATNNIVKGTSADRERNNRRQPIISMKNLGGVANWMVFISLGLMGVWALLDDKYPQTPDAFAAIGMLTVYVLFLCFTFIYLRFCFNPTEKNAQIFVDLNLSEPIAPGHEPSLRFDFRSNLVSRWILAGFLIVLLLATLTLTFLAFTT